MENKLCRGVFPDNSAGLVVMSSVKMIKITSDF